VPATVLAALPPRAGFRRFFTPLACSRREELDPDGGDGLFTRRRRDRTPLVNFCNRNEMRARHRGSVDPRTPRRSRLLRSDCRGRPVSFRSAASRGFTGQEPSVVNHARASSSPRSLAAEALSRPDRLGHLLSQPLFPPEAGVAFAEDVRCIEGHPQGRLAGPRFREAPPFRAASCVPPRRGSHYSAPEVPSIDRSTPERVRSRPARALLPEDGRER
jgi:hypothetical protein